MALFSIVDQAKNALKAEVKKHPEVLQGLHKLESLLKTVGGVLTRLKPEHLQHLATVAIKAVDAAIQKEFGTSVLTDAEITTIANEAAEIPGAVTALEAAVEKAEAELQ